MSKNLEKILCNSILITYPDLKQYIHNKTFRIKYKSDIINVIKNDEDTLNKFNSYIEHYNNRKKLKKSDDVKKPDNVKKTDDVNEEIIMLKKMNERFRSQRDKVIEKLSLLQDRYDKLENNYENFKNDYKRVVEERDKEKIKTKKKHKDVIDELEILKQRNKQYYDKYGNI